MWKKNVLQWKLDNGGERVTREKFSSLLEKTIQGVDMNKVLKSGFRSTGLHPFTPNSIDYEKYFKTHQDPTIQPDAPPQIDKNKIQSHLDFFESTINTEVVDEFKKCECQKQWNGDIKYDGLFGTWLKIKMMLNSDGTTAESVTEDIVEDDVETGGTHGNHEKDVNEELMDMEVTVLVDEVDSSIPDDIIIDNDIIVDENNLNNTFEVGEDNILVPILGENIQQVSETERQQTLDLIVEESETSFSDKRIILANVLSPLKNVLMWPQSREEKKQISMRKANKERLPSIVKSDEWVNYQQKKNETQVQLEKVKEKKKKERKKKKQLQQQEQEKARALRKIKKEQNDAKKMEKKKKNPKKNNMN
ncbi:hypothetical protein HCN44_010356 [Aphidius gifuensis]|uniref:Uncharacterized protein n=1 Tax=Aphidius gifuensis TaxID=684658 RepID=A0A834XVU5_APHGI|nr:hypothetical protein HCN44_010356 [Aphidius gifuensis]